MRRIIVTGSTSMIGTALIEEAIACGVEVYALIRPNTNRRDRLRHSELLHIIEAELSEIEYIKNIPSGCDAIYHFAWVGTGKAERDDPFIQEKNIHYTLSAVELARRCSCRMFIGAGSQAEYGSVEGVIDDKTRFAPNTSYGAAKYAAGLLSRKLCDNYGIVHIWGRVFSVYGRHDNEGTMLDYAIRRFLDGKTAYFSSGTQMWDYLYEKDAGKIFLLLGMKCNRSVSLPIANGKSRRLKEYICILAQMMDAEGLCSFSDLSEGEKSGLLVETASLEKEVGYTPQTTFEAGIREMIKEYQFRTGC